MVVDFWKHKLYQGMEHKKSLDENQIANISYQEFITDPINVIKKAYTTIGLDMDIETENKMLDYLRIQKNLKKQNNVTLAEVLKESGYATSMVGNGISTGIPSIEDLIVISVFLVARLTFSMVKNGVQVKIICILVRLHSLLGKIFTRLTNSQNLQKSLSLKC